MKASDKVSKTFEEKGHENFLNGVDVTIAADSVSFRRGWYIHTLVDEYYGCYLYKDGTVDGVVQRHNSFWPTRDEAAQFYANWVEEQKKVEAQKQYAKDNKIFMEAE